MKKETKPIEFKEVSCNRVQVQDTVLGWLGSVAHEDLKKYNGKLVDFEIKVTKVHRKKK